MQTRILHSDDDIEILLSGGTPILRQVRTPVCFSSWSGVGDGQFFGRGLFEPHQFEGVYVRSRRNHWWHSESCVDALGKLLPELKSPFLYGSSMGGYGALYYGRIFDLPAFALSPQAVIGPDAIPADTRWLSDRRKIAPIFDEAELLARPARAEAYVFFDRTHGQDRHHQDFIERHLPPVSGVEIVDVPFSGHTPIRALVAAKLPQSILPAYCSGAEIDTETLRARCALAYRQYPKGLALHLRTGSTPGSEEFRKDLAFCEAEPKKDFEFHYFLADAYARIDDGEAALRHSKAAASMISRDYVLVKHARNLHRFRGALDAMIFLDDYRESESWSALADKVYYEIGKAFQDQLGSGLCLADQKGQTTGINTLTFICGCGHSGTTLVANMFAAHPDMFIPLVETEMFLYPNTVMTRTEAFAQAAQASGKRHVAEKTPRHVCRLPLMRKMCNGARFVLLVRDGRDVAASFIKRFGEAETGRRRWVQENRLVLAERNAPDVYVLRYEDLVQDPEGAMRAVCDFAQIPFHTDMLNYHETERRWFNVDSNERTDGGHGVPHNKLRSWQVNQPIYDDRGKWRSLLPEADLKAFDADADAVEIMQAFGYAKDPETCV